MNTHVHEIENQNNREKRGNNIHFLATPAASCRIVNVPTDDLVLPPCARTYVRPINISMHCHVCTFSKFHCWQSGTCTLVSRHSLQSNPVCLREYNAEVSRY